MRKIAVAFLVILFTTAIYAQDYFTVIKVSGNIVIERTGSSLDIGTSFAQDENLLFKVPESRAAVINPQRGRFLLTSGNSAEFKKSKSNYLPSATKISMRAAVISPGGNDPKYYFEGDYVILDEIKIQIDKDTYPLTDKKYLFMTYNFDNKIINKKLAFKDDTLFINKKDLLIVDGRIIPGPQINLITLMYYSEGEENSPIRVCSFTPVFPDNNTLSREIGIILDQLEMNPYKDKFNESSAFIKEFYGKVDENSLKRWLYDNFRLEP